MAGIACKSDPAFWNRVQAAVTASVEGGKPGQWSARKAQRATAEYQKRGGGYLGRKRADNHLAAWTREGQRSGTTSVVGGKSALPHAGLAALGAAEHRHGKAREPAATRRNKRTGKGKGMGENDPHNDIAAEFRRLVNIPAADLRRWLDTWESQAVGFTREGEEEAVGHRSGRRILELLEGEGDDTSAHAAFRHDVVGYIHRHLAQRPDGDVTDMRWRHSLMNWGHDPMRDSSESAAMTDEETSAPMIDSNAAQDAPTTPALRKPRVRRATAAPDGATSVRKPRTAKPAAEAKPSRRPAKATAARSNGTKAGAASPARRSAAAVPKRAPSTSTAKRATATTTKRAAVPAKRTTATTAKRVAAKRPAATPAKRAASAKRAAAATTKRASPAKRPVATATKRATGTAAKRATTAKRGTVAAPKRPAAAAPKHGTAKVAGPKRAPPKPKPAARGAAGRTAAAAKGGRSSTPRNRG